jgi:hypothetical protein
MKTFKLIVTPNENCVKVLLYISRCIDQINVMGVRIKVEKIRKSEFDEDMVKILRRRGITRLPVLVAPDGKSFTGVNSITELFEKNLRTLKNGGRVAPVSKPEADFGTNPDLAEFWMKEMSKKDGEDNDMNGENNDFDSKLRQYQSRVPKHRGGGAAPEVNIDAPERQRRQRPSRAETRVHAPKMEDNIDSGDYPDYDLPAATPSTPIRAPKLEPSDEGGADVDQKMLAAWLDNNPTEF